MDRRFQGTVKWFSPTGGFGFILPDGSDRSLYVDHNGILGDGVAGLLEGDRVEFSMMATPRGPRAHRVIRLNRVAIASD
ncbi:MAG: cold-shock protein [Anaerolineae bacterium]